ncbi:MAG: diphosphate--fructose-6-phosphate 1-phosphotransferase [Myxococcaceae bacterium]
MVEKKKKMGILVGGGPAPGINSVIGAATIHAELAGVEMVGIQDGFEWLMAGDIDHVQQLETKNISRSHFAGGSVIGIARANPTKKDELIETCVQSLLRLNIDKLVTIGGDDTGYSAYRLEQKARGQLSVVHVPKTIDNDLDLPPETPTFGFQTARHVGVEIVKNLMVDARTTHRWYFVIAMGRKAGHLALGIGKSMGATLTLIPEEYPPGKLALKTVVDTLVGAIVKRLSDGLRDGVAVLAEGLVELLDEVDLADLPEIERDAHGHIRIAEVNIGEILKAQVQARLKELGLKTTIVAKNIGYELRCCDPIPFDMEYTRDLGFYAARHLLAGGTGALISIHNGKFEPIPFDKILDPKTGRTKVRMVDVNSDGYRTAAAYMIRLRKSDFDDAHELARHAATAHLSLDDFRRQFGHLVERG